MRRRHLPPAVLRSDDGEIDPLGGSQLHETRDILRRDVQVAYSGFVAVPALPRATSTVVTRGKAAHFQASACSRPPPPTDENLTAPHEIEG